MQLEIKLEEHWFYEPHIPFHSCKVVVKANLFRNCLLLDWKPYIGLSGSPCSILSARGTFPRAYSSGLPEPGVYAVGPRITSKNTTHLGPRVLAKTP